MHAYFSWKRFWLNPAKHATSCMGKGKAGEWPDREKRMECVKERERVGRGRGDEERGKEETHTKVHNTSMGRGIERGAGQREAISK